MSFTMSGSEGWSYNRFDEYEAKLKAQKEAEAAAEEQEQVDEVYKGKHGQSDKEYQDGRSDAGKRISGDSKEGPASYATRIHKGSAPTAPGAKPKNVPGLSTGEKAELKMRKANLKKEDFGYGEVCENRRAARAAGGYKDDSKKQTDPSKDGFTGISGSIKEIMKQNKEIEAANKAKTKKEEVEQIDERLDDMPKGDVGHERHKKAMADNQSAIDAANKRIAKQGIQYPKGDKKKFTKDKSDPKVAAGRKAAKEMGLKKEDLEATGLFSAEEIEALLEASCGSKGYQKGGEVKCEKCGGKGCDACEGKKSEKKGKSGGSKPDYLDFDKDGNKDEPMKDALKGKKSKKEDEEGEEGGEGAVSESVTATQRSNSFADAYASMYEAAPLAALAAGAGKALVGGAKLAGKAALAGGKAAVKAAPKVAKGAGRAAMNLAPSSAPKSDETSSSEEGDL